MSEKNEAGAVPPLSQLVGLYWHNPGDKNLSSAYVLTAQDAQDVKAIFEKVGCKVAIVIEGPPSDKEEAV